MWSWYHIFCLSVSNSTAYWLHIIVNNHNRVLCQATAERAATGRSAHNGDRAGETYVWTIHTDHCLDTLCWSNSTADWAYKIAKMRYLAAAKLELTDTVAIQPIPAWYPVHVLKCNNWHSHTKLLVLYSVSNRISSYINLIYEYSTIAMLCTGTLTLAKLTISPGLITSVWSVKMCMCDSKQRVNNTF